MHTQVVVVLDVEHEGELTPDELSGTVGVWVECLPVEYRTITTRTNDADHDVTLKIVEALSATAA